MYYEPRTDIGSSQGVGILHSTETTIAIRILCRVFCGNSWLGLRLAL